MKFSSIAVLAAIFLSACGQQTDSVQTENAEASAEAGADYLFVNAKVYTVDEDQPWAEAVAISGNKITYVGDAAGAKSFMGKETETFDLAGKMIVPGFISGHEHLIASGWTSLGVDLASLDSLEEYLAAIKDYADANPDEPFVRGSGWNATKIGRNPTAADLDAILPDRPAIILDFTIHDMWLNSRALEMGNVTKDTEDPVPGLIYWVRDDEGNPTGYAKEFAWMGPFIEMGAWQPETMIAASQKKLYDMAASYGLTGYINQGLVTPNIKNLALHHEDNKIAMKMLDDLSKEDALKLRTYLYVLFKSDEMSVPQAVANAEELRGLYDNDMLGVLGIKVHPEGVHSSHASVMLEPWSDKPELVAVRGVSAERVEEAVMAINEAGMDLSVHVDGSKTVRETVDAFIRAKEAGYSDARNSLQHYAFAHPDDQQRVISNKIPLNITTIWGTTWGGGLDGALEIMGEKRTIEMFQQIRTAIDGGVSVSMGADVPSSTPTLMAPLVLCEAAITRLDPSNPDDGRVFPPMSQAITLDQCLRSSTIEGAWQARKEDVLGSIEVGKLADLVVLEHNLFDVPSEEIAETKVLATMMDGQFTHRDGLE